MNRGFVFTVDALFACVIAITLAASFYVMLDEMQAMPAHLSLERDLLAALEKTGKLESIGGSELEHILMPYNKCGSIMLKKGETVEREVVACPCDETGEYYVGIRSYVRNAGGVPEYGLAVLKTCLRG
jgi:hypothetical protein